MFPKKTVTILTLLLTMFSSASYASIFSERFKATEARIDAEFARAEARIDAESARADAIIQKDRNHFASIVSNGGTFKKLDNRPRPVCKTKDSYAHYMGFLIGRYSDLPEPDLCWELDDNTQVELVPGATYDEHCNPVGGVCKFKYAYFGKIRSTFWTSIHNFRQSF